LLHNIFSVLNLTAGNLLEFKASRIFKFFIHFQFEFKITENSFRVETGVTFLEFNSNFVSTSNLFSIFYSISLSLDYYSLELSRKAWPHDRENHTKWSI